MTLGDEQAKKRGVQKSVRERAGPPTFDCCIEMVDRQRWNIYEDVASATDALLAGVHRSTFLLTVIGKVSTSMYSVCDSNQACLDCPVTCTSHLNVHTKPFCR